MDWSQFLLQLFAVLPATLIALAGLVNALKAVRKVDDLHTLTNSRMTELLKTTGAAAGAEGELLGAREERARAADREAGGPSSVE